MKEGKLQEALKTYYEAYLLLRGLLPAFKDSMAANLMASKNQMDDASREQLLSLRRAVYGNMCLIYIKQEKYDRVVKFCEEIVTGKEGEPEVKSDNIKPMYRLAMAKTRLGDTHSARAWVERVLSLEPGNTDVGDDKQ